RGNVVLHFHGGGYLIGSAKASLEYASRLAAAVDGTCYTVDYRLAPEHPCPAAIDDAVMAYRALLARGIPANSILVSGESSGGGLALALVLALCNAGDPLPAAILAVAPFADRMQRPCGGNLRWRREDRCAHRHGRRVFRPRRCRCGDR